MGNSTVQAYNSEIAAEEQKRATKKSAPKGSAADENQQLSYFGILFILLLASMGERQKTVLLQSKEITANARIQARLNKEDGDIHFSVLPPNANTAEINRVQEENEQYAAMREDIQSSLITSRQMAQVMMTSASANVDILEQYASEDSRFLSVMNMVFKVIDELTGTK